MEVQQSPFKLLLYIYAGVIHQTKDKTPNLGAKGQKRKKKPDTGKVCGFFVMLLYVTSHHCCHRNIMQGTLMVWLYGVLHVPKYDFKYLVKH